jgi:hypothetical protein
MKRPITPARELPDVRRKLAVIARSTAAVHPGNSVCHHPCRNEVRQAAMATSR